MNTIFIVLPILVILMFDLGLTLRLEDFGRVVRHPWPIARPSHTYCERSVPTSVGV